jgi:hypothetical protein
MTAEMHTRIMSTKRLAITTTARILSIVVVFFQRVLFLLLTRQVPGIGKQQQQQKQNNGDIKRKMQEAEDAPFAVAIELADPTSDEFSSPAYGPFLGFIDMVILGAVVVVVVAAAAATLL